MNLKKILPVFAIVPLVSSCNGIFISIQDALNIINDIQGDVKENGTEYVKFTYTHRIVENGNKTEIKVICDRAARFYYSYRITLNHIEEFWRYEKNDKLFVLHREDGAMDETGLYPAVQGYNIPFTNDAWVEVEQEIFWGKGEVIDYGIDKTLLNHLSVMKGFASVEVGRTRFSSWNSNSVTCEYEGPLARENYRCDILDRKLSWLIYTVEDEYEEEFNVTYEQAHINYLNLE